MNMCHNEIIWICLPPTMNCTHSWKTVIMIYRAYFSTFTAPSMIHCLSFNNEQMHFRFNHLCIILYNFYIIQSFIEPHSTWWHILWWQCFMMFQGIWFLIQYLNILEKECTQTGRFMRKRVWSQNAIRKKR